MQILLFTKIFSGASIPEIGHAAAKLGVDGLDLAVRKGQCITPQNIAIELPRAIEVWKKLGLSTPLLTLEGDFIDPAADGVETIFQTCARCEIPFLKLGYWKWKPGEDYRQGVENARRDLEGFEKLGRDYSVCSLLHTHFGLQLGSNATSVMQLLDGMDSRFVGAYLDPAHQALQGEPPPLAFAIAGEYLKMIGVKNAIHVANKDGDTTWKSQWCALAEGLVNWPGVLQALRERGADVPLSFHATYSQARDKDGALEMAARDMELLRAWT